MTYLLAFAAVFGALDRLWGSDTKIMGRSGHSLGTIGALLAAVAAYFAIGWPAAAMCVAWALYRSLNFSGGAMAPRGTGQALAALGRHLIATGLMCGILAVQHQGPYPSMVFAPLYAVIATSLAIFNGEEEGRYNWLVESLRGAAYGVCVALALGLV